MVKLIIYYDPHEVGLFSLFWHLQRRQYFSEWDGPLVTLKWTLQEFGMKFDVLLAQRVKEGIFFRPNISMVLRSPHSL